MLELYKEYIKKLLVDNNIDIQDSNFKNSENYAKIKDSWILGSGNFSISLDEFIERYLLDEQKRLTLYESKYEMGNIDEIDDNECDDICVAEDIVLSFKQEENMDANEIVNIFNRPGGLVDRLNVYLNLDLDVFDKKDKRNKRERCKILYFFYILENVYYPSTNVLMMLSKPSMENIDNSFLGMQTFNGECIKFIKDSIEKELSLPIKDKIKKSVVQIVNKWNLILHNAYILIEFLHRNGCVYDFEKTIHLLQTDSDEVEVKKALKYTLSPIETLYLKIVQHEYIGNILDISKVNEQGDFPYEVPPELVEEMEELYYRPVNINNIDQYIDENARRISKYVYLGSKIGKEDVRRIKNSKEKLHRLISFCRRANILLNINDISNELQIISFLQVIILDDTSEIFDYIFHGYEKHKKHKPRVKAALKSDKFVEDAVKVYLVRKSIDHWFANLGRKNLRIKVRELEKACDSLLIRILSSSNLDEMQKMQEFYLDRVEISLFATDDQINIIQCLEEYLRNEGFEYEDGYYLIRYAFLNPKEIVNTYASIVAQISDTIKDHDSCLIINGEIHDAMEVKCELYIELTFDYQNNICAMQDIRVNPLQ